MSKIVQSQFVKFHECVKLIDTEDNKILREKRDMLVQEIRAYLKKKSEEEGSALITFSVENQGSYSMGTGIKPLSDQDYDIDIALFFNISKEDYTPVEVKKWVFDALNKNPRTVEYKKPCVRVQYVKNGDSTFHVDLACYANANSDSKIYLSKGKPTSASSDKKWEVSEPKELKSKINGKYSDTYEKQQFKRAIRYLKRWKDHKIKNTEDGKPTGIALTALAYDGFTPEVSKDNFTGDRTENDLQATLSLVKYILNQFDIFDNISVDLPVPPYNDLFEKMKKNEKQTTRFKEKLKSLRDDLIKASSETDPVEACKLLRRQFGDDFPIPPKETTGQKRNIAVVGSTEQAND
ncbi:MAG: nucleotidyltransferase domain-containing protein [Bacteroidota bacterium]